MRRCVHTRFRGISYSSSATDEHLIKPPRHAYSNQTQRTRLEKTTISAPSRPFHFSVSAAHPASCNAHAGDSPHSRWQSSRDATPAPPAAATLGDDARRRRPSVREPQRRQHTRQTWRHTRHRAGGAAGMLGRGLGPRHFPVRPVCLYPVVCLSHLYSIDKCCLYGDLVSWPSRLSLYGGRRCGRCAQMAASR